jgi:hypothetical protein
MNMAVLCLEIPPIFLVLLIGLQQARKWHLLTGRQDSDAISMVLEGGRWKKILPLHGVWQINDFCFALRQSFSTLLERIIFEPFFLFSSRCFSFLDSLSIVFSVGWFGIYRWQMHSRWCSVCIIPVFRGQSLMRWLNS